MGCTNSNSRNNGTATRTVGLQESSVDDRCSRKGSSTPRTSLRSASPVISSNASLGSERGLLEIFSGGGGGCSSGSVSRRSSLSQQAFAAVPLSPPPPLDDGGGQQPELVIWQQPPRGAREATREPTKEGEAIAERPAENPPQHISPLLAFGHPHAQSVSPPPPPAAASSAPLSPVEGGHQQQEPLVIWQQPPISAREATREPMREGEVKEEEEEEELHPVENSQPQHNNNPFLALGQRQPNAQSVPVLSDSLNLVDEEEEARAKCTTPSAQVVSLRGSEQRTTKKDREQEAPRTADPYDALSEDFGLVVWDSVEGKAREEPDNPLWWVDYLAPSPTQQQHFEVDELEYDKKELEAYFAPASKGLVRRVTKWLTSVVWPDNPPEGSII